MFYVSTNTAELNFYSGLHYFEVSCEKWLLICVVPFEMMNKSRLVGLLVLLALALFVQCDDDVNQDVRANSSGEIVEYVRN